MDKKIAIIDLGSNSVRMLIMKVYENGAYKVIDYVKEMVRLSEDMGDEMILKPIAIKRTIDALIYFRKIIKDYKIDKVISIATAAVRNSNNQQIFLERVKKETGLDMKVISGEDEAYYDYLGVINTIQIEDCVIVDIGGASTEIILVRNRKIKELTSLPYGAVLLTDRFLKNNTDSLENINDLEEFISEKLENITWLKDIKDIKDIPIIGLGGSIRTLAKIHKKNIACPIGILHNYQITHKEVLEIYENVTNVNLDERKKIPGIKKERADIIVGGLAPIKVLMDYLNGEKLIVSGNGLREGLFFEDYMKDFHNNAELIDDVLHHSVENVLKNFDANMDDCYIVQKLALDIFDKTIDVHTFGVEEKKILSVSALMYDIGKNVDFYNRYRHGFYLVLNSNINGLCKRELVMSAFIVAMHLNMGFKKNWKEYDMLLDKNDYTVIKKLSIILKLAEKLARSGCRNEEDVLCNITLKDINMLK